jgi:hypothetical protein
LRKRATVQRRIGVASIETKAGENRDSDQLLEWFPPMADAASTGGLP